MSAQDHELDHQSHPKVEEPPVPDTTTFARDESATPEAVEAAHLRRGNAAGGEGPSGYRGRGVDWVRSSDLLARGSGHVSRSAIDFHTHLASRTRDALSTSAQQAVQRARRLPPVSAFGRRRTPTSTGHSAVGMT